MDKTPTREYLVQGKPLAEQSEQMINELAEQRAEFLREQAVDFPEGNEFVSGMIDFGVVKDLIAEEYAKMGLSREAIPDVPLYFFDPQKLGPNQRGNLRRAAYVPGHDVVLISKPWVEDIMNEVYEADGEFSVGELRLLLAPILHEKMHTVSGTVVDRCVDGDVVQSGLGTQKIDLDGYQQWSKFLLIDEALNELWSEQLVGRYLARVGFSKEAEYMVDDLESIALGREPHASWGYKPEVKFLLEFIQKTATALQTAPEQILNALKRAKVGNGGVELELFLFELSKDPVIGEQFSVAELARIEAGLLR